MNRILFYVQHLLGIGHLARAGHIAAAMADLGMSVDLVMGGTAVPGFAPAKVKTWQLPVLKAGPKGFSDLRDAEGNAVGQSWKEARRDRLLKIFADRNPDVLILEAFPFGRRQMRFELDPLLDAAWRRAPKPKIVTSVRDILQESRKLGRTEETLGRLTAQFDAVLVHGDPAFVPLEMTFPAAREIAHMVHYTGFVAASDQVSGEDHGEIVVSAGGGAVGRHLLETAVSARSFSQAHDRPWRLLAGPNTAFDFAPEPGITVEPFRDDFPALLAGATLSISQCGYNTMCDLLRARCRAVVVPYSTGGETEQSRRAERLAEMGLAQVVSEDELSPQRLAGAVDAALASPYPRAVNLDMNGANASAGLIRGLI